MIEGAPGRALACFSRRTITRTAAPSRGLSGAGSSSACVTVLSMRTIVPLSSLLWRALHTVARLMASQLAALIALIVLCSTDFLGDHDNGSRAKARNEAESS